MDVAATRSFRRWPWRLSLLVVILIGFFIRFDSLVHWLDQEELYFFGDRQVPVMLTVDAYYYLDIAEEVGAGSYEPFDARRQVPDGFLRSPTPPFLSVVLAGLTKLSRASLEWVAVLLPPFLSAFVAVAGFLLGRVLGLEIRAPFLRQERRESAANGMGLATALFALLSPDLVSRGIIGWCDTDTLNVAFSIAAAYLALCLAEEEEPRRRRLWFAAWAVNFLLFLGWWDQAYVAVFALAGLPMTIALVLIARRSRRGVAELLIGLALLAIVVGLWRGFGVLDPASYVERVFATFRYITGNMTGSSFAAVGAQASEVKAHTVGQIARETAGGWLPFLLAAVGLLGLIATVRRQVLFLLPLLAVGALSLKGQRFEIFAAPLFGLGMGFITFCVLALTERIHWRVIGLTILLLSGSWGALATARQYDTLTPVRRPVLFDAMRYLRDNTPDDAVIWTTWGNGHPMIHYSKRSTPGDGIFHPASLQYALAFPLATDDLRLSANWISFYVAHGHEGLKRINRTFGTDEQDWTAGLPRLQQLLAAGVEGSRELLARSATQGQAEIEELLAYVFPGSERPVFLFLDYLLLRGPWFSVGRWNFETRTTEESAIFALVEGVSPVGRATLRAQSRFGDGMIDLERGSIRIGEETHPLRTISIHDGDRLRRADYPERPAAVLVIYGPAGFGIFTDLETSLTALIKLYFELQYDDRYFEPVAIGLPAYSVWRVQGDAYGSPH